MGWRGYARPLQRGPDPIPRGQDKLNILRVDGWLGERGYTMRRARILTGRTPDKLLACVRARYQPCA
jgi:hypothetical protein